MLLNFSSLIKKYSLSITGIVHVGAHEGEEVETYHQNGIANICLIEPCGPAFKFLLQRFGVFARIELFNVACGSYTGEASMFVEKANHGQSNSLLKPANHLKHYPEIQFTETELVQVRPLDALSLPGGINMLVMDVQGAECQVLTGATHYLKSFDYIYTEVNEDGANLYEGACGITELDAILHEFSRVETKFTRQGWGDALYLRKSKL